MIKDGDVRSTVESVLNGAEDVLSFLFTNSGSALRRVKSKERKKKVNGASKEVKSDLVTDHTANCTPASKTDSRTAVVNLKSPIFSSQVNNDKNFTQWTPLSLSDFQTSKCTSGHVDSSVKSNELKIPVTQLGKSPSCTSEGQGLSPESFLEKSQGRSSLLEASPALTFSRKPRKFVYRVQNSERKTMPNVTGTRFFFFFLSYFLCVPISPVQGSKLIYLLSCL